MVLAIGLLVDDAIVVIENVERVMAEEGLSPRDATRKSMGQITGALCRHRACARRSVPAHGVFQRIHRRDLPAVLDHDGLGHGAIGVHRVDLHPGALRDDPDADRKGAHGKKARLLRPLQPDLQARQPRLRERRESYRGSRACLSADLRCHRGAAWSSFSCACPTPSCPTRTRAFCSCR